MHHIVPTLPLSQCNLAAEIPTSGAAGLPQAVVNNLCRICTKALLPFGASLPNTAFGWAACCVGSQRTGLGEEVLFSIIHPATWWRQAPLKRGPI